VTQGFAYLSVRRRRRLTLLVLPALLLRALIPAGFMPYAGAGGPHIGFCPGAGALPAGVVHLAAHAAHVAHAHHGSDGRGVPGTPHHPACIFSAGAATTFAVATIAALPATSPTSPPECVTAPIFLPTILRAQSSRGPPRDLLKL
jgi:hypothetical protein